MNLMEEDGQEYGGVLSEKFCHTCLCDSRTLQPITDQASVKFYLYCISEIPLSSMSIWNSPPPDVCWECRHLLQKVVSFKQRIQDANRLLQAYSKKNIEKLIASDIIRSSRLSVHYNQSVDISPATEIEEKVEEGSLQSVFVKNEALEIVKDEDLEFDEEMNREEKICSNDESNSSDNIITVPLPLEMYKEIKSEETSQSSINKAISESQQISPAANVRKRGKPKRRTKGKRGCTNDKESKRDGCNSSELRDALKKEDPSLDDVVKKIYDTDSIRPQKARVECGSCDKTFSHRAGLWNHTGVVHRHVDKFPCECCGKVFKWRNSLIKHAEKHNKTNKTADSKPFCIQCDVTFASVASYKRHLRNSLKHVPPQQLKFVCDHCERRYVNKTKLRDHIEEKHLKKTFHCHLCLKPSKNRVCLDQHLRNVHRGRPNNKICQYCGKGFPTKMQLESHIRAHTGERPYICEYCPTTFSQQSNLYKHYRQVHLNKLKVKAKSDVSGDDLIRVGVGEVCLERETKVLPEFRYDVDII